MARRHGRSTSSLMKLCWRLKEHPTRQRIFSDLPRMSTAPWRPIIARKGCRPLGYMDTFEGIAYTNVEDLRTTLLNRAVWENQSIQKVTLAVYVDCRTDLTTCSSGENVGNELKVLFLYTVLRTVRWQRLHSLAFLVLFLVRRLLCQSMCY